MKKILMRRPSPAMIIAIVALVAALGGSAVAAGLNLGALSTGAKNKTVGVGKLTYLNTTQVLPISPAGTSTTVAATCPSGLRSIGGGAKISPVTSADFITDAYLTATGYTAHYDIGSAAGATVTTTVACAASRAVTGAPPAS